MNRKRLNEQVKDACDTEQEHCYAPTPTGDFRLNAPKFRTEDVAHKEASKFQKIEKWKRAKKNEKSGKESRKYPQEVECASEDEWSGPLSRRSSATTERAVATDGRWIHMM